MKTIFPFGYGLLKKFYRSVEPYQWRIFWEKAYRILRVVLLIAVLMSIAFLISFYLSEAANIRLWYFTGLISYIIISCAMIYEADEISVFGVMGKLLTGLLVFSAAAILVLLIGFVLNLFIGLSLPFQIIFSWPIVTPSVIIFFILAVVIIFAIPSIAFSSKEYDEY